MKGVGDDGGHVWDGATREKLLQKPSLDLGQTLIALI